MTDQPHTPTTEQVREAYVVGVDPEVTARYRAEFNRWLAGHEDWVIRKWTAENDVVPHERYTRDVAAAEQRGEERVLKYFQDHVNEVSEYSYIGAAIQELIVQASENRADQMEEDDE